MQDSKHKLVILLDAYDEVMRTQNLFSYLNKWNAQVIITCRKYMIDGKKDYKMIFTPEKDQPNSPNLKQFMLQSPTQENLKAYVEAFVKTSEA